MTATEGQKESCRQFPEKSFERQRSQHRAEVRHSCQLQVLGHHSVQAQVNFSCSELWLDGLLPLCPVFCASRSLEGPFQVSAQEAYDLIGESKQCQENSSCEIMQLHISGWW